MEKLELCVFEEPNKKYIGSGPYVFMGVSRQVYLYKNRADGKNPNGYRLVLAPPKETEGELETIAFLEPNPGYEENQARPFIKGNLVKAHGGQKIVGFYRTTTLKSDRKDGRKAGDEIGYISFSYDLPKEEKQAS